MKILEKKIDGQVQFWSLLGPFLILSAIGILLFKFSEHWYLPLGVLVGIPLCVKWHMKGLCGALAVLISLFFLNYAQIDLEERYWHLGMGIAMALSFIILTLSLEEVQTLINKIQAESQSRLDNFLKLDENVKQSEQSWLLERAKLSTLVEELSKELTQKREDANTYQKLVYLAKDELITLRHQYEHIIEDSLYKKQHIAQLQERIDENEMTIQNFVNTDSEKKIKNLTAELNDNKMLLNQLRDELDQQEYTIEELAKVKISLENDLMDGLKKEREYKVEISSYAHELNNHQTRLLDLELKYQELNKEKNNFETELRALQNEKDTIKSNEIRQKHELTSLNTQLENALDKIAFKEKELNEIKLGNEKTLKQIESSLNEKENHIENLLKTQQDLENAYHKKDFDLINKIKEYETIQNELRIFTDSLKHSREKIQNLELEKNARNIEIDKLNERCKSLENEMKLKELEQDQFKEASINNGNEQVKNIKRIESMYNQLKEQFEEKNAVLDQTRQQLFVTQENLLALGKEFEENLFFNPTENELLLQNNLIQLDQELNEVINNHEQEINHLQGIIQELINRR